MLHKPFFLNFSPQWKKAELVNHMFEKIDLESSEFMSFDGKNNPFFRKWIKSFI